MDDRLEGIEFLIQLDRANIQYEVVYEDRFKEDFLKGFSCVVAYGAKLLSDDAVKALAGYARNGGRLLLFGENGAMTNWGQPRTGNPLAEAGPWTVAGEDKAAVLRFVQENTKPAFSVVGCPYVLFTTTRGAAQPKDGYVVHLLNYQKETLGNVRVRLSGAARPKLVALTPGCGQIEKGAADSEWVIPRLGVYSLLIVEP